MQKAEAKIEPIYSSPFDREFELKQWMRAFEEYAVAHELCRMDRDQVTAAVENTANHGRPAADQAEWLEHTSIRLQTAWKILEWARARVETVGASLDAAKARTNGEEPACRSDKLD